MSDGNFNRALLPAGGLQSGLAMGKRIARAQAAEAFSRYYLQRHPSATPEEINAERDTFLSLFPR